MLNRKRQFERDRKKRAVPAPRVRTPSRRRSIKTAELAKARAEGEARNAARALGKPAPARKRKKEPVVRKPVAKPNTSIPALQPAPSERERAPTPGVNKL